MMSSRGLPKSLRHVHRKIEGQPFTDNAFEAVVKEINQGLYSEPQIAAFLTSSAAHPLSHREIFALTKAMVSAGTCLSWEHGLVVDKHCIGGLPGNRTTPIIVSVLAAVGLRVPKTSSRAITSAAGTADVMEVLAPVHLTIQEMKTVIENVGGCIVWGGAVGLSPVDDELVRVAREIGVDGEGQLVSSILSKKFAAGATHLIIDIPVGPTAKIKDQQEALSLKRTILKIAIALDMVIAVEVTDGSQPVGFGIGPALEARDVIAVLQNSDTAPIALRDKAMFLSGCALELSGIASVGEGMQMAFDCLSSGQALKKFKAICEAQGGLREIPVARYTHNIIAQQSGTVSQMDNRKLARLAKLAGAPEDKAAGLDLHVQNGSSVLQKQSIYTLHSNSQSRLKHTISEALKIDAISIVDD